VKAVLVISARDNVATALEPLERGRTFTVAGTTVTATESIPRGHKVAIQPIRAGEAIVKYGSPIGTASVDITSGAHVHTHNLGSARGRGDLAREREGGAANQASAVAPSQPRIAEPPDTDDEHTLAAEARER
jgi:altronate hydrolase